MRLGIKVLVLLGLLFPVFSASAVFGQDVMLSRRVTLMGSVFQITVVDRDSTHANENIDRVIAEVSRIEDLISEWQPQTPISQVNRQAGIQPVKVDREVFDLTQRALQYANMSDGAFDISVAGLDQIWRFDGSMDTLPDPEVVKQSIAHVGYKHILLDSTNSTIYLKEKSMKIGFGSIGKGYAADKGRELMKKLGVKGGIVNASGDMATWGKPLGKATWHIGITNPFHTHKILKTLKLREAAMATSGSTQKYAEIDGVRYAHIINPKTGYPATGLSSVTIYGPSAEFANALSTSVMVLGAEKGRMLVRQYPEYHYIFVTDHGRVIKK